MKTEYQKKMQATWKETLRKLHTRYQSYVATNNHNEAANVLVSAFGSEEEKETLKNIIERSNERSYISREDLPVRDAMIRKYYPIVKP
jgi:hypothetical protein